MKQVVIDGLVTEARRSLHMAPIKTPFGVKKAHIVYYNCMLGHGVKKEDAKSVMKQAATQTVSRAIKASHLETKGIMRDAIKEAE